MKPEELDVMIAWWRKVWTDLLKSRDGFTVTLRMVPSVPKPLVRLVARRADGFEVARTVTLPELESMLWELSEVLDGSPGPTKATSISGMPLIQRIVEVMRDLPTQQAAGVDLLPLLHGATLAEINVALSVYAGRGQFVEVVARKSVMNERGARRPTRVYRLREEERSAA